MERFANFRKGIRNVKINIFSFSFQVNHPSCLFDTTNPDQVPTLKLGHDKLTITTSKATVRYSRSKERSTKKIKLKALSNKQKTSESSVDVDFNTENLETYSNEINSQCMISFSDTPLLSSTILNSNENEK